jgi:hypothetical protein
MRLFALDIPDAHVGTRKLPGKIDEFFRALGILL